MPPNREELVVALRAGDPAVVAALIAAGADVRYTREHGYTALLDALYERDVARDPRLLDLLRLLIGQRVALDAVSDYKESALRVLSHLGRFDAVQLLLEAGADEAQLGWTPLIRAVALGTAADVEAAARGADLEAPDWWSRTPFLVAVLTGDLNKARLLFEKGGNASARGRCGAPALSYAVQGRCPEMLRWLLDIGHAVDETDDFGQTPLMEAVEQGDLPSVDALIAAGADLDRVAPSGPVLGRATSREVARRLLDAGADPRHLSAEGHRALCGLGAAGAEPLAAISREQFEGARTRVFGTANPEPMPHAFWYAMVRAGVNAHQAAQAFDPGVRCGGAPVWCAQRFGQSISFLPDGRVVQVGGEHEDHYDPDFCIYNDVFVHGPDGALVIYGYPEDVFPPTDFHTATLVGDAIYVIGGLGYLGARGRGATPVYRLDTRTFRMERVETTGDGPGWIHDHRAARTAAGIRIWGGTVVTARGLDEDHRPNVTTFELDLERRVWRRES